MTFSPAFSEVIAWHWSLTLASLDGVPLYYAAEGTKGAFRTGCIFQDLVASGIRHSSEWHGGKRANIDRFRN